MITAEIVDVSTQVVQAQPERAGDLITLFIQFRETFFESPNTTPEYQQRFFERAAALEKLLQARKSKLDQEVALTLEGTTSNTHRKDVVLFQGGLTEVVGTAVGLNRSVREFFFRTEKQADRLLPLLQSLPYIAANPLDKRIFFDMLSRLNVLQPDGYDPREARVLAAKYVLEGKKPIFSDLIGLAKEIVEADAAEEAIEEQNKKRTLKTEVKIVTKYPEVAAGIQEVKEAQKAKEIPAAEIAQAIADYALDDVEVARALTRAVIEKKIELKMDLELDVVGWELFDHGPEKMAQLREKLGLPEKVSRP